MNRHVVTFGEIMLCLALNGYYRFSQNDQLQATLGGRETNVAISLANYGLGSVYATKLPGHTIGQVTVSALRSLGVDTSHIVRGGDRVGTYFLKKGVSQRGSMCIHDRTHSTIQGAQPADFDWDVILVGANWFHFTGIMLALGPNVMEIYEDVCRATKARGVKISCDLNYRGKLWTWEQIRATMSELCWYMDVCISGEGDAKSVFGIEAAETDATGDKLNKEGYKNVVRRPVNQFGLERMAITLRSSISASDNDWAGTLYDREHCCFSREYHLHIVDQVGGGDSFGGGLIYVLLAGKDSQVAIGSAIAASTLKYLTEGDFNRIAMAKIERLTGGDGSGRIQY